MSADIEATDIGLRLYPWMDVIPDGEDRRLVRSDDVITSEQTLSRMAAMIQNEVRATLPYHTVSAIAVDEWQFKDIRTQDEPSTLAYFRDYLKRVYENIASLNKSWSTQMSSFDQITLEQCAPERIRDDGVSPVPWADLQAMKEDATVMYLERLAKAAGEITPNFRLGLSGTRETTGDNGLDWYRLMQVQGSVATYGGFHTRLEESFRRDDTCIYQWSYATGDNIQRSRYDPWNHLLRGYDGYSSRSARY